MLTDLRLSFGALRLSLSWGIALLSTGAAIALFVGLAWGCHALLLRFHLVDGGWLEQVLAGLGALLPLVFGFFFFPALVSSLVGLFIEPVLARVERVSYPDLPSPTPAAFGDQLRWSLRAFVRAAGLNLMLLPFYFVPFLNVGAYGLLNAYLLGKDYFYTVALRRFSSAETETLYKGQRARVWSTGAVIACLFLIPGLNLLTPILGATLMLHRFSGIFERAEHERHLPESTQEMGEVTDKNSSFSAS